MPSRRPFKKKFKKKKDDKVGGRKKKCRFCRSKNGEVDYKDVNALRKLTTLHGKIFS